MPEAKTIRVYYEGDDDRNVLEQLQAASLLPANWEIAKRDHYGKEGTIQDLVPFIDPASGTGKKAVVLLDLDDQPLALMGEWFRRQLQKHVPTAQPPVGIDSKSLPSGRVTVFELSAADRTGSVALVAVGVPEDTQLRQVYGLERFTIDDYLLRLISDGDIYSVISDFREVPYETAHKKLLETAGLLRSNGLAVQHSKRFLHLLRAFTSFRASSAEFVKRLTKAAFQGLLKDRAQETFRPLLDDLHEANAALHTTEPSPEQQP